VREDAPWPSPEQWAELEELNTLDELSPAWPEAADADGLLELAFDPPMPGVSYLEILP
jgi:xylan 1,4-beta-xylosidase